MVDDADADALGDFGENDVGRKRCWANSAAFCLKFRRKAGKNLRADSECHKLFNLDCSYGLGLWAYSQKINYGEYHKIIVYSRDLQQK